MNLFELALVVLPLLGAAAGAVTARHHGSGAVVAAIMFGAIVGLGAFALGLAWSAALGRLSFAKKEPPARPAIAAAGEWVALLSWPLLAGAVPCVTAAGVQAWLGR